MCLPFAYSTAVRRFLTLSAVTLLLLGCGGGGGDVACEQEYWDGTYGTCLPTDWAVLDPETLRQRGVPEGTIVAFQSEVAVSGQFPSIAVTREVLARVAEPIAYSDAGVRSVTVLPQYKEVDVRDLSIDGETVHLHIFTAQPVPEEPTRRFYQVSTVGNGVGYTITATTPVSVSEEVEEQLLLIVSTSTFVAPKEE